MVLMALLRLRPPVPYWRSCPGDEDGDEARD
jgi:hypothetical protein